ncbi:beta-N-acetylglucosaminidase domain-containing protein [Alicyclobacillus curvatus]|nr:beta-N-acetylglucosaminidase domain-containing protein [Alicyclobacillus curvatus]
MTAPVSGPFPIRGVMESFYGVYYTFTERNQLISFLGEQGWNYYIYGPKNDRQHRNRWREPYPEKVMEEFRHTASLAKSLGVTFCYALSPISIAYSSETDFALVTEKLKTFYDAGIRAFSLFLDDIQKEFVHPQDYQVFETYSEAHVSLCNRVYSWLQTLGEPCTLSMCPTDYHGAAPFSDYLRDLGLGLTPEIDVFYTGPHICSQEIRYEHVAGFAQAAQRPPLLWDNYPVNDLAMQPELHIGPIIGRDAKLAGAVRGIVANTMIQAEASKIPLLTYAEYMTNPDGYQPTAAWQRAMTEVAGEENALALATIAPYCLRSCLSPEAPSPLDEVVNPVLLSLQDTGHLDAARVQELKGFLSNIDEACYRLKNRMDNYALRNNLLPWIELLEHWHWAGQRAVIVLQAIKEEGSFAQAMGWLKESVSFIERHPKIVHVGKLADLIQFAIASADKTLGAGKTSGKEEQHEPSLG